MGNNVPTPVAALMSEIAWVADATERPTNITFAPARASSADNEQEKPSSFTLKDTCGSCFADSRCCTGDQHPFIAHSLRKLRRGDVGMRATRTRQHAQRILTQGDGRPGNTLQR